ncbi:unnamed protein product [Mesocestoides corti]|uniref:DEP domain-containing protein n=1 Tax=Mesocestoides corti TaxID=53468 RepID=A0A0R3UHV0_MESCO|nr:unnamed protein product [Mesocestoides corti]
MLELRGVGASECQVVAVFDLRTRLPGLRKFVFAEGQAPPQLALKFWRSRFLILPVFKDTTQQLCESLRQCKNTGKKVRCDIYETPLAVYSYDKLCEKFITFIESLNRIRRVNVTNKTKQFNWPDSSDLPRVHHDPVLTNLPTIPTDACHSKVSRRSGNLPTSTQEPDQTSDVSPSAASTPLPPVGSLLPSASPLSTQSEIWRILAGLLDPEHGLAFITGNPVLPKYTFCSYDLVQWLCRCLSDVTSLEAAVKYAQSLVDARLICHTSGNTSHKFLHGFFFYTVLAELASPPPPHEAVDTSSGGRESLTNPPLPSLAGIRRIPFPAAHLPPSSSSPLGAFSTDFQKEWAEILIIREAPVNQCRFLSPFFPPCDSKDAGNELPPLNGVLSTSCLGQIFGSENDPGIHVGSEGVLRKRVTRDIRDSSYLSILKRHPEWYCLLYDLNYHPTCAFSMEIQWLVASPNRINDLLVLYIYYRATSPGFHIVPAPCYPFGYSSTRFVVDPLRLPVFIQCRALQLIVAQSRADGMESQYSGDLSAHALAAELFPELPEIDQMTALFCFQETILSRFGFMPLSYSPAVNSRNGSSEDNTPTMKRPTPLGDDYPRGMSYTRRMYAHVSGGMFVMIPLYTDQQPPPQSIKGPSCRSSRRSSGTCLSQSLDQGIQAASTTYPPSACSYATTLCSENSGITSNQGWEFGQHASIPKDSQGSLDPRTSCFNTQYEAGFFWTWNYLLPRKWRSQITGDEAFQDGMLEDFRAFCSGGADDTRLVDAFDNFKSSLAEAINDATPMQC